MSCQCGFGGGGGGGGGNVVGAFTVGFYPRANGPASLVDGTLRQETGVSEPGIYNEVDIQDDWYFVRGSDLGAAHVWKTSNGTVAAPTAVSDGAVLARLQVRGYTGAEFLPSGEIVLEADEAPAAGVAAPGRWRFSTWNPAGAQVYGLEISKDAVVEVKEQIFVEKTSRRGLAALAIVANETDLDAAESDIYTLVADDDTEFQVPTNPQSGRSFMVRIKMDGATAITFDAAGYRFATALALDYTVGSFTYLGFMYNEDDAIWDCVGAPVGPFGP